MSRSSLIALAAGAALLMAAIGVQLLKADPALTDSSLARGVNLSAVLPARLGDGTVHDEPIATTEEMKKAVNELLNYNDAVFRIYHWGGRRISVYAAWWKPGRMSPRLVATHVPDVCWPGNGWVRDDQAEEKMAAFRHELMTSGLVGGECRVFRMRGAPEYMVYWHKVGSGVLSYHTGSTPPWWAWLDELWRDGLALRKEQLFVRISSDSPLEIFWPRAEMAPLREALLRLGLKAPKR